MRDGVTFRRYREDDHAAVWSVFAAASTQVGFAAGPWDEDMRSIAATYLAAGGEFLVGEVDGAIVAHAGVLPEAAGRAKVRRVAVHPAVQRRGIGQALMAELEARARQLGFAVLVLDASQPAAHALYRRCGYREVGREVLGGIECVVYEKYL